MTEAVLHAPRTYEVHTYGCQMNVHDSERLSGSLEAAGYVKAVDGHPDVVVINTCAVRENADNKLYGNLGMLASTKRVHDGMQIAVGGCLAQMDKQTVLDKAPWVDVVFGTHNMGSLPSLLERARHNGEAELEILESLEVFPSTLPTKRDSIYSGWVSISVGCNNTCTFCIVPSLRGKEADRRPGDVLAEVEMLVADGVLEVTLLGQNVNSYGAEFGDRAAFAKLLRACGTIDGLERVRFTSPHPKDFTSDVIEAMAETANVCHQLHMPLQSGSDRMLRAMRRSYRSERYLRILSDVRAAMPDAAVDGSDRREVHQPAVSGPAAEPSPALVLLALTRGHQHLDRPSDLLAITREGRLVDHGHQSLEAFGDHRTWHLIRHRRGGRPRPR